MAKVVWDDLHRDAHDAVRGVPETDVPCVRTTLRRPPWHHNDEYLDQYEEHNYDVPRSEVSAPVAHALVPIADNVEAGGEREVEEGLGVRL